MHNTFMTELPMVRECCKSSHTPDEALQKTCCALEQLADDGVTSATAAIVAEKIVEMDVEATKAKVVEKSPVVGQNSEDIHASEIADEVIEKMSGNVTLNAKLDEAVAALNALWTKSNFEIEPNDKQLVKTFYGTQEPGLSWTMSCVAKCENQCATLGGEQCQPIQSPEDCQTGAGDLGKTYAPLISQADKDNYPKGCFMKTKKPDRVRWNAPTSERPHIRINNICGCYR
jgi:hypothetical protein